MSNKQKIITELAKRIEEDKPEGQTLVAYIELALDNWFEFKDKNGAPSDGEILDFLDKLNRDQNSRYNSNYGWQVDVNHNRVSLNDMGRPGRDVRTAIVDSMLSLAINKEN
ncbi:hypothetical protein [Vibrio hepatarius]|uniref:hypothetical protein n=1 Tax=Vibrio hepatarius TaxID=171383 RepID=UPI00148C12AE|nr:hypothetical protein [Vibrio hepatarius]NOI16383.1 hypothetical protein [Vibrio hepatarius]